MGFLVGVLVGLTCAGACLYWLRAHEETDEETERRDAEMSSDRERRASSSQFTTRDTPVPSERKTTREEETTPNEDSSATREDSRSREHSPLLEDSFERLRDTRRDQTESSSPEPRESPDASDEHATSPSADLGEHSSSVYSSLGSKSTTPDRPSTLADESSASTTAASSDTDHWLVGLLGEVEDEVFEVADPQTLVGRGTRCDLQITQGEVSRTHCRLRSVDGKLILETTDTVNDTLVDGTPIEAGTSVELEDGDIVEISGVTAFEYRRDGEFDSDDTGAHESHRGLMTDADTIGADNRTLDRRIEETLERTNGDLERAAKMLGMEPDNLEYLVERLDIDRK